MGKNGTASVLSLKCFCYSPLGILAEMKLCCNQLDPHPHLNRLPPPPPPPPPVFNSTSIPNPPSVSEQDPEPKVWESV